MSAMELREPLWLLVALIPLCCLVASLVFKLTRSGEYTDSHLLPWVVARDVNATRSLTVRVFFIQLAWLFFAIALAGPRSPESVVERTVDQYHEVIIVVDVSASMSARDVLPGRIQRARLELLDLVDQLQTTKMSIVVFAAQPHLLTPFTNDKSVLRHYIATLTTDFLPTAGSRPLVALNSVMDYFSDKAGLAKSVILISDGDQQLTEIEKSMAISELRSKARQKSIQIHTLGIGTKAGAAILTLAQTEFTRDETAIVSKLNPDFLQAIANAGNGKYQPITDDNQDWQNLYHDSILRAAKIDTDNADSNYIIWNQHFAVFLILGALFFILSAIPEFRINLKLSQPGSKETAHVLTLVFVSLLFVVLLQPGSAFADVKLTNEQVQKYNQAIIEYQSGELESARKTLERLPGYNARFAEAVINYELEQYRRAVPLFIQATLDADNQQQRINAIFNLANSYYRLEKYATAADLYQNVLNYDPAHNAANVNLSYALELHKESITLQPRTATRQGRGPTTADIEPGQEIIGRVSLGNSDNSDQTIQKTLQDEPALTANTDSRILQDSRLASEKVVKTDDPEWTYEISSIDELKSSVPSININESTFWKRLFETEENYDAPQDQPNLIPGVDPW